MEQKILCQEGSENVYVVREFKATAEEELWSSWNQVEKQIEQD